VPGLKAIVFDLDDTLYLERDYTLSGFRAVAGWADKHLAIPADEAYEDLVRLFEEGVRNNTFDVWLAGRGKPPSAIGPMVRVYRDHEPEIKPLPAVRQLLLSLRLRYALGLMSDGYLSVQRKKLAALDLENCFDVVVFSDELGRDAWKPSARPFGAALDGLGVTSNEAVYVADNPVKDFLGARRAGMWSIRVRAAEGIYRDLAPASPDFDPDIEIERLEDVVDAIEAIENLILTDINSYFASSLQSAPQEESA